MPRNGVPATARRRPETWEERFRYGWRYVWKVGPDGRKYQDQVPLTLEDVLHPQEGDTIPEAPYHEQERGYLSGVFRARFPGDDNVLVLSDCLVNWGVRGLRNTSPDVSVFKGVRQRPNPYRGTFLLARSRGRAVLAVEIVSPDKRVNDVVHKVTEYHQARIPLYVIIDQEEEDGPRTLIGYRYTPRRYVRMRLDGQGRLLLKPLGVRLGLVDDRVVCFDAQAAEPIGDYTQVTQALQAEAAARQAEAAARQVEATARQAAEDRVRELEEELRRLRGQGK